MCTLGARMKRPATVRSVVVITSMVLELSPFEFAAGATAGDSGHDTSTPPNDAQRESLGDAAPRTTRSAPEVPARGAKANAAPTGSLTGGKCRSMGNESCARRSGVGRATTGTTTTG